MAKVDRVPGVPDDELPEITEEMLDRATFAVGGVVLPTPSRGRPPGTAKKESTTLRIDRDVLAGFRATGPGWQTRMNDALRQWLETHPKRDAARRKRETG